MFKVKHFYFISSLFVFVLVNSCNENKSNKSVEATIDEKIKNFSDSIEEIILKKEEDKREKKIISFFKKKNNSRVFNGNILFAENGKIIAHSTFGYANFRKKEKLTTDHSFQLASASKPITAVATLQLIENGKLNLNDTIQSFFPEFPYKNITIHQLLSHRSGMSQYTHFCDRPDSIWPDKKKTINNNDVIKIMSDIVPLINYPPNYKYYYCNTNYLILASIVEKVSNLDFNSYLKKYIFNPVGMNSTVVYNRTNYKELILPVQGYEGRIPWEDVYLNGCVGDKGVYSTTMDLLKFDRALKQNLILSDSLKELAFSKKNKNFRTNNNYGYGFRLKFSEKYGKIIYHTGWWKGFRSYYVNVPRKDQTIIVLNNVKRGKFLNIEKLIDLLN
tara:strand:- start:1329 stop:2495 length:1167 start_codon:yes stop_codon:yes gene_type:complete